MEQIKQFAFVHYCIEYCGVNVNNKTYFNVHMLVTCTTDLW